MGGGIGVEVGVEVGSGVGVHVGGTAVGVVVGAGVDVGTTVKVAVGDNVDGIWGSEMAVGDGLGGAQPATRKPKSIKKSKRAIKKPFNVCHNRLDLRERYFINLEGLLYVDQANPAAP